MEAWKGVKSIFKKLKLNQDSLINDNSPNISGIDYKSDLNMSSGVRGSLNKAFFFLVVGKKHVVKDTEMWETGK